MNITKLKHMHFVGIKGVGMTSLALCAKDLGIKVTGSDVDEVFVTDEVLKKRKIKWKIGFGKQNLEPSADLVVTTGAHGGLKNEEVLAAKKKGIKVMTLAEALGKFSETKDTIAVCGVGGKSTTASIIATLLDTAKYEPSFAIGVGNIFPIGTPGRFNIRGKHFVCEADEYAISPGINNKPRFSYLSPKILVVTNIEHDHPDVYPTFKDTKRAFRKFFSRIGKDGLLIACYDSPNVEDAIGGLKVNIVTYGFNRNADWQIKDVSFKKEKSRFSVTSKGKKTTANELVLKIPGRYNIQNATAAFIVGEFLGLSYETIKEGIKKYKGCRRRFEKIGEFNGILAFDDFAHHPKEIRAVLAAAREWFPERRIVAVFQPHTYSRTKALLKEFAGAFGDADVVAFMDIYASAREVKDKTISSKLLTNEAKKYKDKVYYSGGHKSTLTWLKRHIKPHDLFLTLGGGDVFNLHNKLLKK